MRRSESKQATLCELGAVPGGRGRAGSRSVAQEKPMRVPPFICRLFAGETGAVMMTELRGASNAKAKRELGWQPRHPSRRPGFAT
jgi:hypothetical protein